MRFLRRRAMLRGPLGGSREWTLVWALFLAVRLLRRLTRSKPEVVYSEELLPGQTLVLSGSEREPRVIATR
ncbi:MAG: hypothetical protein QOI47_2218 [Actinomycetota bacterium]|jgi:hypothetical protein|nr:hypothetical protein [Actinomycetota bacterium]